jgi:hypothetical protein
LARGLLGIADSMRWTPAFCLLAVLGPSGSQAARPRPVPNVISHDAYLEREGTYHYTPARHERATKAAAAEFRRKVASTRIDDVVLVVGIPGAGKTTYVAGQAQRLRRTLFFDATMTTPERRAPLIHEALRHGKPVRITWMNTPLRLALERNARRPPGRRVPDENVEDYHRQILAAPPELAEGALEVIILGPATGIVNQ